MDYFGITNRELAGALGVDPSLVSRWLNGQRKLKAASGTINVLAEYILTSSRRIHDIQWLKTQLERDELPVDLSTVYRIKQSLILWLASDGEDLRRNLIPARRAKGPSGKETGASVPYRPGYGQNRLSGARPQFGAAAFRTAPGRLGRHLPFP